MYRSASLQQNSATAGEDTPTGNTPISRPDPLPGAPNAA
jgi:hypothetical protein